jgi:DNA processing protein
MVTMADDHYPSLLLEIPDPPPFVYRAGELPETEKNIAMVGSRNATTYGLATAGKLSSDLAASGVVIVSGMALGSDTAAHKGALTGGGKTVAVLGSGLSRIYPAQNQILFKRITENGGVISEFPLKAGPEGHHFPMRNRIISGMSLGTVVVEATRRSGSLITARLAAEQNRDVFAVPGSIQSFKSTGTHTLIKQGAKLVENAQDVIEEFPRFFGPASKNRPRTAALPEMAVDEKVIFNVLGAYPTHIDEISRQTKLGAGRLSSLLMQMELKGLISQAPGKMFTRHMNYC